MKRPGKRPPNDEYEITMDKSVIDWPPEVVFAEFLESQGKIWKYHPCRIKTGNKTPCYGMNETYEPDFYCPNDQYYYEVSASNQAYHSSKKKIIDVVKNNIIHIVVVKPNGEVINSFRRKPPKIVPITVDGISELFNLSIHEAQWLYSHHAEHIEELSTDEKNVFGIDINKYYPEIIRKVKFEVKQNMLKRAIKKDSRLEHYFKKRGMLG